MFAVYQEAETLDKPFIFASSIDGDEFTDRSSPKTSPSIKMHDIVINKRLIL